MTGYETSRICITSQAFASLQRRLESKVRFLPAESVVPRVYRRTRSDGLNSQKGRRSVMSL